MHLALLPLRPYLSVFRYNSFMLHKCKYEIEIRLDCFKKLFPDSIHILPSIRCLPLESKSSMLYPTTNRTAIKTETNYKKIQISSAFVYKHLSLQKISDFAIIKSSILNIVSYLKAFTSAVKNTIVYFYLFYF